MDNQPAHDHQPALGMGDRSGASSIKQVGARPHGMWSYTILQHLKKAHHRLLLDCLDCIKTCGSLLRLLLLLLPNPVLLLLVVWCECGWLQQFADERLILPNPIHCCCCWLTPPPAAVYAGPSLLATTRPTFTALQHCRHLDTPL